MQNSPTRKRFPRSFLCQRDREKPCHQVRTAFPSRRSFGLSTQVPVLDGPSNVRANRSASLVTPTATMPDPHRSTVCTSASLRVQIGIRPLDRLQCAHRHQSLWYTTLIADPPGRNASLRKQGDGFRDSGKNLIFPSGLCIGLRLIIS